MKTFKQYLQEAVPTNAANANNSSGGFSSTANASGPVAGFTPKLFPGDEDLLSQDYQTAAETGEDRYTRFSAVYPVMKVSLKSNVGDGPSIDDMVNASMKFTEIMDSRTEARIRKNFRQFMAK
tara:strand:- start:121 stop:489 length:369 start_codon:yes stop_codon:yes gene_type:complete